MSRTGQVHRKTGETEVRVSVNLDGGERSVLTICSPPWPCTGAWG